VDESCKGRKNAWNHRPDDVQEMILSDAFVGLPADIYRANERIKGNVRFLRVRSDGRVRLKGCSDWLYTVSQVKRRSILTRWHIIALDN